jgi:hypothetical protein
MSLIHTRIRAANIAEGRSVNASPVEDSPWRAWTDATVCSCLIQPLGITMPAMDYGVLDYGDMNWLAVFCAGLAYWLLGAIWYSAILSKMWRSAVEELGVKVCQPNQGGWG